MAINLATGFSIGSKDVIDERQVLTLNQMQNLDENVYPDNYFAICKDNGKLYLFNASNEINAETGKFRVLSGGTGGGDTTYVLPPATDTTLGGVKVDNVTITVDSEGVITAINSYTKTEVDDLLNNKLDKPVVDGTAGQILVLQDDGSLAYEDNVGSGTTDLTEINNKLAQLENKTNHTSIATITVNSKTFKIDIDKVSSGLNGNIKFGYCVNNGYGEIIIYSLGASEVRWNHSTGVRYVNSVTYTIDPDDTTHITIGVEFYGVVYGVHQIETPRNFATINSFTGESYTGTSVATRGGIKGINNGVGIFYEVTDLGLTAPCTTVQIAQAMRNLSNANSATPSVSMIGIFNNESHTITDSPTPYGLLQINVYGHDKIMIRYEGLANSTYTGSWIGQIKGSGGQFNGITWSKITKETDLTNINTTLAQLETKAALIPVVADNPTDYDLNNYKENGNYSIGKGSDYANSPEASAGLLTVMRANTYRLQLYTVINNNNVYFRKSSDWGVSWKPWVLLNESTDLTEINDRLTQLENTTGGGNTNNDVYSTEEQAVGTWVNGKTLYRKSYTNTYPSTQGLSGDGTLLSFGVGWQYLVNVEGIVNVEYNDPSEEVLTGYEDIYPFKIPFDDTTIGNIKLRTNSLDYVYLYYRLSDKYNIVKYNISVYYYKY